MPSGQAASERRVVRVEDVFADPELEDWQEVATELGFRSIVALPLVANTNVLGVLTFYFSDRSRIAEDALRHQGWLGAAAGWRAPAVRPAWRVGGDHNRKAAGAGFPLAIVVYTAPHRA